MLDKIFIVSSDGEEIKDPQKKYYTEYQYYNGRVNGNSSYNDMPVTLEQYILVLMANGLLTEIDQFKLYDNMISNNTPGVEPVTYEVIIDREDYFEDNSYLSTLEEIKRVDSYEKKGVTSEQINNSMFRGYEETNNWDPTRSQDLYKGEDGFFEFVDKLYKDVKSSSLEKEQKKEAKEIISLVEEAAIFLYDSNYAMQQYGSSSYSSRTYSGLNQLDWIFDTAPSNYGEKKQMHIWKYSTTTSPGAGYSNDWSKNIEISDGARTFIKIYTDLIKNYASLDYRPAYGSKYISNSSSQKRYIDAQEYNNNF